METPAQRISEMADGLCLLCQVEQARPVCRERAGVDFKKIRLSEHVRVHVAKRSELHTLAVTPKRWVVQRSLVRQEPETVENCERDLNTSLQFVYLASGLFGADTQEIVNTLLQPAMRCGQQSQQGGLIHHGHTEFLRPEQLAARV